MAHILEMIKRPLSNISISGANRDFITNCNSRCADNDKIKFE